MSIGKTLTWSVGLVIAGSLAGCGPEPIPQAKADATFTQQVKPSPPPSDKWRLYAMLGRERGGLIAYRNETTAELQINGLSVGAINPSECLVVDPVRGTYTVNITDLGTGYMSQQTYALACGQAKIIALDLQRNMAGLARAPFGAVGATAAQSARPSPTLSPIVRPTGWPQSRPSRSRRQTRRRWR